MNEFGKRFADLRKEKGLTQEDIANKLNVSSQAVSKWENGISYPDVSLFVEISEILGVSVDYLLGKKEGSNPVVLEPKKKDINKMLLKIVVNSKDGEKVRVNLPFALIKVGLESGMAMPQIKGNNALKDIDWMQILDLVNQGVIGRLVEVESADGDIVEIYVE